MNIPSSLPWESHLLNLAREGLDNLRTPAIASMDADLLERAYQACAGITRVHSRTFMLASAFLPAKKRRAIRALYAFCRRSDDIVDSRQSGDPLNDLADWRCRSLTSHPSANDPVAVAWADTRHSFRVPVRYAEQLLDGVASDLEPRRYASFEDLAAYAYRVAATVGLMSMHIIGFTGEEALPYAIKLGVALQITNILRDVGEDWRNGRLYLPLDELSRFGLTEADVAAGKVTPAWRRFMRFQIERVRNLYNGAWPGISMLDKRGRFSIAAAAGLYEAILEDIEGHDYDVFSRRASISGLGKLGRLPSIWLRMQTPNDEITWFEDESQIQARM